MVHKVFSQTDTVSNKQWTCQLRNSRCLAFTKNKVGGQPRQCNRVTFRHPFCLQHCKNYLGLTVKPSRIAGCGLVATKTFKVGDVLLPYTGQEERRADLQANGIHDLPYAFATTSGNVMNAACQRGLAAYANASLHGQHKANITTVMGIIRMPEHQHFFGPPDPQTGMCEVQTQAPSHAINPFRMKKGWKRIHVSLLQSMSGKSYPWFVCTRPISVGDEILLTYGPDTKKILQMIHSTIPSTCS